MGDQFIRVVVDASPNLPKNDQSRESLTRMLREKFEDRLADAVERVWALPPILLQEPSKDYVTLLIEARDLFIAGYFYSCVAMCGIVGERLIKDAFRASILINKGNGAASPTDNALDRLERVDISGIVRFLREAELLGDEAGKAAQTLGEIRNQYAHARGKDPYKDAIGAIKLLHVLIEGTVSVFKDFEITDRGLIRKTAMPAVGNQQSNQR